MKRVNFECSVRFKEDLRALQERTDAASLSEVIRRAVNLYGQLTDGKVERVVLRKSDGTTVEVLVT